MIGKIQLKRIGGYDPALGRAVEDPYLPSTAERELIRPQIVPMRMLGLLARNGVHTIEAVHEHIKAGTLCTLKGVGPYMEQKIIHYYTRKKQSE